MKIAQIAPLFESVPPRLYGGTERVVSYLTEELVAMGHDVTLWASGDSRSSAKLAAVRRVATRLDPGCSDPFAEHVLMIEKFAQVADEYDVAHFHIDYLHFPLLRRLKIPFVNTLHGRLDLPELKPLYQEFREVPVVSISDNQREPLAFANWQATIHHGLPRNLFPLGTGKREPYLVFLGRISEEKGVAEAIHIARSAGREIRIAAKLDRSSKRDREYMETVVEPLLKLPGVNFLGEVDEAGKWRLLARASALLFPIQWPEPFGLVMLEAMACGTPVIAYRRGSVPEVIRQGITGFMVDDDRDAVRAVRRIDTLDPRRIRAVFEERFTSARMAADYVRIYRRLAPPIAAAANGFGGMTGPAIPVSGATTL